MELSLERGEKSLANIINKEISLDTALGDFLTIAGWNCWMSSIYQNADDDMRYALRNHIIKRKMTVPSKTRTAETRFINAISFAEFTNRSLKDFKQFIETYGPTRLKFLGHKSYSRFNEELQNYGIEPFKVGGYGSVEKLRQYGLEKM